MTNDRPSVRGPAMPPVRVVVCRTVARPTIAVLTPDDDGDYLAAILAVVGGSAESLAVIEIDGLLLWHDRDALTTGARLNFVVRPDWYHPDERRIYGDFLVARRSPDSLRNGLADVTWQDELSLLWADAEIERDDEQGEDAP